MDLFEELKWRGLINSVTNDKKIKEFFNSKKGAYIGFDPTAPSLHLGNYVMIVILKRLKNCGIPVFPVIGGATGMIGDPSGKHSERVLLSYEIVNKNKLLISSQLKKLIGCETIIDNLDNYKNISFLDFLRDVGKLVNINYLLEKEIIKNRLETTGISYTEFSYNLIQSYDFVKLYTEKDVTMQIGGSDQWGNITSGIEMIRKIVGDNNSAVGLTINLLTNSNGQKFGKSEKGAIFLDSEITSCYEMYQYLFNQTDEDVIKLLKFLTFLTPNEIIKIEKEHLKDPSKRLAQKTLASCVVNDIHGPEELKKVEEISTKLFSGDIKNIDIKNLKILFKNVPTTTINSTNICIVDLLVLCKIVDSKTQARQLIKSNSIHINGDKIDNLDFIVNKNDAFEKEFSIIRKGKKNYYVVKWN